MFTPPAEVRAVLAAFAPLFTRPTWARAQALVCGTLLAPANHTLTAALRVLGLAHQPGFQNYHRLLNRARWSARQAAQVLLGLLVAAFVPSGPVIVGLDETIERRRGRKLTARAIYRDAARSSKDCFQKTSGLRWMSLALLAPVGWAARVWALPFLTALCPSERYGPYVRRGRRHKPLARARPRIGRPTAPLAARPHAHRGGRWRLRRPGAAGLVRAASPARHRHYPFALGCGPLPAGARAPTRPKRPAAA
jgi:hypothetical protein